MILVTLAIGMVGGARLAGLYISEAADLLGSLVSVSLHPLYPQDAHSQLSGL